MRVIVSEEEAFCTKCHSNILEITNIRYAGETKVAPKMTEELYECRKCGTQFVIQYPIFDAEGHIESKTFSGDINDPTHNWQDNLSEEQIRVISEHMKICTVCQDQLDEEILKDAWFASIFKR